MWNMFEYIHNMTKHVSTVIILAGWYYCHHNNIHCYPLTAASTTDRGEVYQRE